MEANTNTVPWGITQIQHQTASWQVWWRAQTRLRVETQLLPYDILNFCPTMSSHILSGLENLPFSTLKAPSQRDRQSERQGTLQLKIVKYELQFLQQDVFIVRMVPIDLIYLYEYGFIIQTHTALCPALQTPLWPYLDTFLKSRLPGFTPLILSENAKEKEGNSCGSWKRSESGSEDSHRIEGSCCLSTLVFH